MFEYVLEENDTMYNVVLYVNEEPMQVVLSTPNYRRAIAMVRKMNTKRRKVDYGKKRKAKYADYSMID